jgi:hypothetical protein
MTNGKPSPKSTISSGIESFDILIDGFSVGDNVVWEIESGSSSDVFIRIFIARSFRDEQKVIYISFNRSPQKVLNGLESILSPEHFTLIDCFTSGKEKTTTSFKNFTTSRGRCKSSRSRTPRKLAGSPPH